MPRRRHTWPRWIPHLEPQHVFTDGDSTDPNLPDEEFTDGSAPPGTELPQYGGTCGCLGAWAIATFGDDPDGPSWYALGGIEDNDERRHPFGETLIRELKSRNLWRDDLVSSNDAAKGREQELCDAWNSSAAKHGFVEVSDV